jgi:hypothetical protein
VPASEDEDHALIEFAQCHIGQRRIAQALRAHQSVTQLRRDHSAVRGLDQADHVLLPGFIPDLFEREALHFAGSERRITVAHDGPRRRARQVGGHQRQPRGVGQRHQWLVLRPVPAAHQGRQLLAVAARLVQRGLLVDVELFHQQGRPGTCIEANLQQPGLQSMVLRVVVDLAQQQDVGVGGTAQQFGFVDEALCRGVP